MSWQDFKKNVLQDAKDRALTELAPLVLRQVGGLLVDTASRLENNEVAADPEPPAVTIHHHGPRGQAYSPGFGPGSPGADFDRIADPARVAQRMRQSEGNA